MRITERRLVIEMVEEIRRIGRIRDFVSIQVFKVFLF